MKAGIRGLAAATSLLIANAAMAQDVVPLADVAHIHGVAFDARHPGQILLATHYGLYRSEAGGLARIVSQDGSDYMGFSVDPSDPGVLLASGHPAQGGNLGVIASNDGGITWSQRSPGASGPVDFHAMTVSRADPATICGLFGAIQVSRDGGKTWSVAGSAPERTIDLAASALDANTLYAGTVAGLAASSDGGATWRMRGEQVPMTMVETAPDGRIYAFYAGVGLVSAEPDGSVWRLVNGDLGAHDFLHFAVDPDDARHMAAVTQDSLILESSDGGTSWSPFDGT
ncbi:MAG: exo-alpha-sialidase [Devosia sp.]|uniref:WD40/YVTN/BNR-like repeat-containing protein n=1 Tax=Devosia sp. 66-22 TaxID=1895753 RepID=UPI0009281B5C|nr:exo-alpha-sialidase [Devosia sp. 66-22]MBN9345812.1 exo-alpha-sialidase [Devosia sp.]OJX48713.1 MAG: hypothetical protein BGO81_18725 [Devosia sp. 66-22]